MSYLTARRDRKRKGSPEWVRLGGLLAARRPELDPAYSDNQWQGGRVAFARDRGINLKLAQDIETNARENFTPVTLRDVIAPAYAITFESILGALDGGDLIAAPGAPPRRPAPSPVRSLPPRAMEPGPAAASALAGFVTDEVREKAQPYADEIWRAVLALALESAHAPGPDGDDQVPDPGGSALFGAGSDYQLVWDSAAGHAPLAKTWLIAVLQSRDAAAQGHRQGTG